MNKSVFSIVITEEELKLFSEFLKSSNYDGVKCYSSNDKEALVTKSQPKRENKKVYLDEVESNRGLGRSVILGGVPGAAGGFVGKKYANKLDRQGSTDSEIKNKSTKRGAAVGAVLGGLLSGGLALAGGGDTSDVLGATALGAVSSALGGGLGARKNASVRLKKRSELKNK